MVDDTAAVLLLGFGPLAIRAPVRVVYLLDEPDRQGFAYGTLPGHPETGEEAFVLTRGADGRVTFAISAFSRPVSLLARVAGPAGVLTQRWVTGRYCARSGPEGQRVSTAATSGIASR